MLFSTTPFIRYFFIPGYWLNLSLILKNQTLRDHFHYSEGPAVNRFYDIVPVWNRLRHPFWQESLRPDEKGKSGHVTSQPYIPWGPKARLPRLNKIEGMLATPTFSEIRPGWMSLIGLRNTFISICHPGFQKTKIPSLLATMSTKLLVLKNWVFIIISWHNWFIRPRFDKYRGLLGL